MTGRGMLFLKRALAEFRQNRDCSLDLGATTHAVELRNQSVLRV